MVMSLDSRLVFRSAVDPVALTELIGNAPADFAGLVLLCERDFPGAVASLRAALLAQDADMADRSAHSLKGMLRNLCAEAGGELAEQIGLMAREGRFAEAEPRVAELEVELGLVVGEIRALSAG